MRRDAIVLCVVIHAIWGCAGKTRAGESDPSGRAGADDVSTGGHSGGGSGATSGAGAARVHDDPPPAASGVNTTTPGQPGGDQVGGPGGSANADAELERAHQASATCVQACNVLNGACDGSGFNHCDLSCPGRLAGDAKCAPLVENAYRCLADHVQEVVACIPGRDPAVRCGICDSELSMLAQGCGLPIECQL